MLRFGIEAITDEVDKLLGLIAGRARDLQPFFEGTLSNRVYALIREVWKTEGKIIGHPWPQLQPSTLAAKARINRQHMGILRRYNTLWASLTKRSAPQGIRIATASSLTIGTTVPYAAAHQDPKPGSRNPQRKMVPDAEDIPSRRLKAWESVLVKYLEDG